jgi:hypothetical protein
VSDVRDSQRDQPLPKPGRINVQAALRAALHEREAYGRRKYGTALETDNGRDALTDAWEEALDLVTYLTQMRLERGDLLPGMPVCPQCGDSLTGYDEDDLVWRTNDARPYCSGECVIAMHRIAQKKGTPA